MIHQVFSRHFRFVVFDRMPRHLPLTKVIGASEATVRLRVRPRPVRDGVGRDQDRPAAGGVKGDIITGLGLKDTPAAGEVKEAGGRPVAVGAWLYGALQPRIPLAKVATSAAVMPLAPRHEFLRRQAGGAGRSGESGEPCIAP